MPSPIANNWTIRKLIQNTYNFFRNRFEYMNRDVLKSIRIKKINVYDGRDPGEARTTFIVESSSFPQYHPYYTKRDARGRERRYQRKYKHQFQVTIQLDRLSIDAPVKLRTGAARKWDFSPQARGYKNRNGEIVESKNVANGINGDFFFRLEALYHEEGILYGRNFTNGPARITNPMKVPFLDKHALRVVQTLLERGFLKKDF